MFFLISFSGWLSHEKITNTDRMAVQIGNSNLSENFLLSCVLFNLNRFFFSISRSQLHRAIDLDRKPLLYDYYANTLNPIYHKRNFDEIDRASLSGFKRNFDEIDRSSLSGFHAKRNFDEIDRTGLTGFHTKRNFDEIDRSALSGLIHRKRYAEPHRLNGMIFNEVDRNAFTDFMKRYYNDDRINTGMPKTDNEVFGMAKKNFDEIDRSALNGLKRTVRKVADLPAIKDQSNSRFPNDH